MLLESPIIHFAKFLTILILGMVFFGLLGKFLLKTLKISFDRKTTNYFSFILVGAIFTISVYAVIKTYLATVMLLVILFFLGMYFSKQKNDSIPKQSKNYTFVVPFFLVLLACFTVLFYLTYYYSNAHVFGDNLFYANVAQSLIDTGVESNNIDWTLAEKTPVPYHYFEAWFIALFTEIFKLNTIAVYSLIYVPFGLSMLFLGSYSIAATVLKSTKVKTFHLVLLAVLYWFIQIFDVPFSSSTPLLNYFFIGSAIYHIKYAIVYLIFMICFLLILEKKYLTAFWFCTMLVPLYSTIAPAVLTGLFVLLLYLFVKRQIIFRKFIWLNAILFSTAAYYALFYYLQKSNETNQSFNFAKFTESFAKLSKIFGFLALLLLMAVVVYYFWFKKTRFLNKFYPTYLFYAKSFLLFMLGAFLAIFLIFPVVNAVSHDAFQLLSNFLTPIYSLVVFVGILYLVKSKSSQFITISSLGFLIYFVLLFPKNKAFSINYSPLPEEEKAIDFAYYQFIKKNIHPDSRFAYFRNYEDKSIMYAKPFLFLPDSRIAHFTNHYIPLGLSVFDLPKNKDSRYVQPESFAFYTFVENQKKNKNFKDLNQSALDFILQQKINCIIVEKGVNRSLCVDSLVKLSVENQFDKNKFFMIN